MVALKRHANCARTKHHDHDRQPAVYVATTVVLPAPIDLALVPSLLAAVFVRTETLVEQYHQCLPSEPEMGIPKARSLGYLEIPTFGLIENGLNKHDRHRPVPTKYHPDFFGKRKLTIVVVVESLLCLLWQSTTQHVVGMV